MKIMVALGGNAISREDQKGDIPDQINNCHITVAVKRRDQNFLDIGSDPY